MRNETRRDIANGHIAAIEYGQAETAELTVVFIHGWLDNAASFETVMGTLHRQAKDLHLCAIDLPGHGLSSAKNGNNFYSFHDYIDDLFQFLANLSPNRLVLVGHSLGALIASCYSAAFPEQVSGLVQIEGYGPLAEEPQNTVSRLREGVMSRQRIRRKPTRAMQTVQEAIDRRAKVNQIEASLIAPIVERGLVQTDSGCEWRHDVNLQSQSLYRMSQQHADVFRQHIRCPQLIILGEQGFSYLQSFQHDASDSTHIEMIEGGHHCHLQAPSRVVNLIFGLVNKI
ncbi:starvation lipoprotein Slp-like protein [Vibrio orientalis CIP 102891 = ATCC 33934]|uniref:Predicted hydrolase/acyltransferase n=1 Tax=Vibrio orientalis CIP 102891 = ATCC 33934 TaxID=675816 RepID=C9QIS5_VIBOR|nr:alpha/beta hydrolase [Vibrio orientalis]EEX92802.1 predicted hydrolase/acyltransferase [Vibrio orientalis CIP 102891 = ATCC 33934]EGU52589.1 starvation lipoprotein Slp-like protein [Vibrio orientalis CIP 102891 = ATCC 33934]